MIISILNRYRIAQYIALIVLLALVFLASILGHALVAKNRILENQVRQIENNQVEIESLNKQVQELQAQVKSLEEKPTPQELNTTPPPQKAPISAKKTETAKTGEGSGVTATWYNYSLKGAPDYSKDNSTCASRDYPRGTKLKVSASNGSVVCVVNDYGPQSHTGHAIDLSSYAFKQLAPLSTGVIKVRIERAE